MWLNLGAGALGGLGDKTITLDISHDAAPDVVGDARCLPFPENFFDGVFSHHMLEHLTFADVAVVLHECYRVLHPGGHLVVHVPFLDAYCAMLLAGFRRRGIEGIYGSQRGRWEVHMSGFDTETLAKAITEAGCVITQVGATTSDFDPEVVIAAVKAR